MRNYWLKIVAGALGIFAVGMLGITGFRTVRGKVIDTINSTDPIPIPVIGLVPFRLGTEKLGSVSRVEFTRSDPEQVSGVRVLVKLADSVSPQRLSQCQLAIDNVDNIGDRTTFRCEPTTGPVAGLEPFGVVVIKNTKDTFPLLLPARAVADLRATHIRLNSHGLDISSSGTSSRGDSIQELIAARTDSMREMLEARVEARGDSADALKDRSSELEDSASTLPAAQRRKVQRSADSVRALMRAVVDRMKGDEARLNALEEVSGLSPAERDSLARLGSLIRDSVQTMVARELQKVHDQLEQNRAAVGRGAGAAEAPPAPPAKPAPASAPRPR
ncbi:MAG TPA: hypothetical protein VG692_18665 [Gemmatimonadales bacterium]|nr:hypothetical protein [Gemmatimonadales bacterium]